MMRRSQRIRGSMRVLRFATTAICKMLVTVTKKQVSTTMLGTFLRYPLFFSLLRQGRSCEEQKKKVNGSSGSRKTQGVVQLQLDGCPGSSGRVQVQVGIDLGGGRSKVEEKVPGRQVTRFALGRWFFQGREMDGSGRVM